MERQERNASASPCLREQVSKRIVSVARQEHDDRITITIPFPSYIPRARGIHAVGKFGTLFKAKCTEAEKELIQTAADTIGVSATDFVRWCVTHCAKEVLRDVPDA